MSSLGTRLLELYVQLGGGVLLGWVLGRLLPKAVPALLGQFLFWIGVPIGIFSFLRGADLSGSIWIASVAAWVAILVGAGLAWAWSGAESRKSWSQATQGSFILASMVGNTGYLGYPLTLAIVGQKYFAWAIFYDLLGSTLGAYGLGVVLAARFGMGAQSVGQLILTFVKNPALWSFGLGLAFRNLTLPESVEQFLRVSAWSAIAFALVLIGMRLSELSSWGSWRRASISLSIKMLLVPLVVGGAVRLFGVTGAPQLVIVLQMAMPPALATLILAEAYNLDRDMAVTAIALGAIALIVTLPVLLLLFAV